MLIFNNTTADAIHVYQLLKITAKDFVGLRRTGFNNTNLSPVGLHGINLRIADAAYKENKVLSTLVLGAT